MPNDKFYLTREWQALRLFVLRRDRWRCVWCGARVHQRGCARIDHIIPRKEAPHLARDANNLRTLCTRCDAQRHAEKGRKDHGDFGATETGQPRGRSHWWNQPDVKAMAAHDKDGATLHSERAHTVKGPAPRGK